MVWKSTQGKLICLSLAFVTLALYSPALTYPFNLCDDSDYIINNPALHHGITRGAVQWALLSFHVGNWHPLTWLSLALDRQIFGPGPGGHHFVNVILHAANTLLLFMLLRRCTGALWRSAIVSALFGWHPLRVESVVWISERKDVLSTFFFLLAILAYIRYASLADGCKPLITQGRQQKTWLSKDFGPYCLSLALFACGLMSKGMVVTLPFVLLLLDFWPLDRVKPPSGMASLRLILEKLPFFILSALISLVTLWAQSVAMVDVAALPIRLRILNALGSYARYVLETFYPRDLVFYPYWRETTPGHAILALVGLVLITAIVIWQLRRRHLFVGWFWFLGTLIPVIGLVQVGFQSMADRYTYIPSIGLSFMIVWGAFDVVVWIGQRLTSSPKPPSTVYWISGTIAGAVLTVLLMACFTQIGYWHDTKVQVAHCIEALGGTGTASLQNDLAYALYQEGNHPEAAVHYRRAIELPEDRLEATRSPRMRARINLADILFEQRDFKEAESQLKAALKAMPIYWKARSNLGDCLAAQGRLNEAVKEYQGALKLAEGDGAVTWHALGVALNRLGKSAEALSAYRRASHLDPENPIYLNDVAWFLATDAHPDLRNGAEAVRLAQRACELTHHQEPQCVGTLDAAYAESGKFDVAVSTAIQARELALAKGQPGIAEAADQRLTVYKTQKAYHLPILQ